MTATATRPAAAPKKAPIIAKDGGSYAPHPAGQFRFVCADVHDEGEREKEFNNKAKMVHEIRIVWQSEVLSEDGERVGRPWEHSQWYTLSLNEKANLRKLLEAWRGKAFSDEELRGFDVAKLIGVNAYVQVAHVPKKSGGTKAVVQSIMLLPKGMTKLTVTEDFEPIASRKKHQDDDAPPPDEDMPAALDDDDASLPF